MQIVMTTEARVNRARFLSWIFMGIAYFFVVITFLLILTLLQAGSRLTTLVQLFSSPRFSQKIVLSDLLDQNNPSIDFINEAMIRTYIITRHSRLTDHQEMMRRWGGLGELALLSTPALAAPFRVDLKKKVDEMMEMPPVDVEIRRVKKIGRNWQVDFDIRTYDKGKVIVEPYAASLRVENYPERSFMTPFTNNPLGTTITEYNAYPRSRALQ